MHPTTIAMISDFFHPDVGGVENHIFMLSSYLIKRHHKVIVITRSRPPDRTGVRWLLPSLKVYYIPFPVIPTGSSSASATLPNYLTFLPYLRVILLREHVCIVHAHAALSSLGHEGILHSWMLGVRTVFTDHSLFGFEDAASILTNKLLTAALKNVDAVICVSHIARENTVLRAQLFEKVENIDKQKGDSISNTVSFPLHLSPSPSPSPSAGTSRASSPSPSASPREDFLLQVRKDVYVIPNAIVVDQFKPAPTINLSQFVSEEMPDPNATGRTAVTIVVISRLAYRKGIDLLVASAPRICKQWPEVRFIIGGSGPKLNDLLQMRERHLLEDRVTLLGPVSHSDVPSVLARGQIFLNTSLTESFGIAILEAACAGLYVVSTRVGGVPEVLPEDMVLFAKPEEDDLFHALSHAIQHVSSGKHDPHMAHERVKSFYHWADVAERTEKVYENVLAKEMIGIWERITRTMSLGTFAGPIYTIILIVDCLFFMFLEWYLPKEDIDYVQCAWRHERYAELVKDARARMDATETSTGSTSMTTNITGQSGKQ